MRNPTSPKYRGHDFWRHSGHRDIQLPVQVTTNINLTVCRFIQPFQLHAKESDETATRLNCGINRNPNCLESRRIRYE